MPDCGGTNCNTEHELGSKALMLTGHTPLPLPNKPRSGDNNTDNHRVRQCRHRPMSPPKEAHLKPRMVASLGRGQETLRICQLTSPVNMGCLTAGPLACCYKAVEQSQAPYTLHFIFLFHSIFLNKTPFLFY